MNEVIQKSDELAYIFFQNKAYELAARQADISLTLDPMNPGLLFNAAKCHYNNQDYNKAIDYIKTTLMFKPNHIDAKRELALYLSWIGEHEEAVEILKELPQDDRTKFNLGWYELTNGNFQKGFELLECGRPINCWGSGVQAPIDKWNGKLITGKRLLVVSEGGNGDEIIFLRFLLQLRDMGVAVSFKPSDAMYDVFKRIEGIHVIKEIETYDCFDVWAPLMSLPYIMKIDGVTGNPYLKADPDYVKKWKQIIKGDVKVGVRWQGGRLYEYHQRRTLPTEDLVESIQGYGTLYSLQKDSDKDCPEQVVDLEDQLESWEDTIAAISLMDLVVTSCTAIAHIAGALGKKTIVIVPTLSYFTWAVPGTKTDWYDSVKIIRQTDPTNWNQPIGQLKGVTYNGNS